MPDFVAEMTQQRAIGFAQFGAALLAYRIVGLGEIQCDDAVLMAGQHHFAGAAAPSSSTSNARPNSGFSRRVSSGSRNRSKP